MPVSLTLKASLFQVNVHGPFLATWAVKDGMCERGYGRIVNISSIAATTQPRPTAIEYATSKSALNSFTRHIGAALAPEGVRVNCVAPGLTATELAMSANPGNTDNIIAGTPMGRIGQVTALAAPPCCRLVPSAFLVKPKWLRKKVKVADGC